ncbi:type I-E CRISPR-associated protein Cse2/CasB [Streptomyces niveiscabiei]|uniref:type I-E CRISPR-associated protein Cse2/CasB n=1 Tax=Streptomyces niveiscabiei TaxID=164115 RepID=UPI0029A92F36|nr:type I-E CRISPR-associated protein Cse2/CasB [Streptomyces niveiscabiei]MDX3388333.1 type I-E CRISPR-associated protein Cse2/CasB [Streptomyces niveiscabiei]
MSTTTRTAKTKDELLSLAEKAARKTVEWLQYGYRENNAAAVAAVARLRREAGREPHASPTSWGIDDLEVLTKLRAEQREESDDTAHWFVSRKRREREMQEEREDRAVHLAVTLWALHQQSVRDEAMHVRGWSLGRAVRRLAQEKGTEAPAADDVQGAVENASSALRKRFVRLGTSSDIDVLGRRLREIVLLLREARIPVDYGRLAGELDRWQDGERQADVRRAWGREFHRVYKTAASKNDEEAPQSPAPEVDFVTDDAGE